MPYISSEQVKQVRQEIKKSFPGVKFSVTKEHCTSLHVCIMESNIDFTTTDKYSNEAIQETQINHFYIKENFPNNKPACDFLLKLVGVIHKAHPEKIISVDSDYGSIPNYYLNIRVGKWDKPYQLKAA